MTSLLQLIFGMTNFSVEEKGTLREGEGNYQKCPICPPPRPRPLGPLWRARAVGEEGGGRGWAARWWVGFPYIPLNKKQIIQLLHKRFHVRQFGKTSGRMLSNCQTHSHSHRRSSRAHLVVPSSPSELAPLGKCHSGLPFDIARTARTPVGRVRRVLCSARVECAARRR